MDFDHIKPVVFYGAGRNAAYYADIMAKRGIHPVCWVDRDTQKQYADFLGCMVLPLHEAFEKYPGAYLYLTVCNDSAAALEALVDEVTGSGVVERGQILNFLIHKKYKSCHFLQNEMTTYSTVMFPCCVGTVRPTSKIDFDDYGNTVDAYLQMREKVINDLNAGESRYCSNCPSLCENYWVDDTTFHTIHIIDEGLCNLDCVYCIRICKAGKLTQKAHPNHGLLLKNLEECGLIDKNHFTIDISCDELTVLPYCDEIVKGLSEYAPYSRIMLFSNATVFNPEVAKMMSMNSRSYLICSVDAGTRKTFQAIKNRDMYDTVVRNLTEYSRHGVNIELKYIVLPGLNDNFDEAKAFMELCQTIKPISINISREIESCVKDKIDLPDNAIEIIKWFISEPDVKLGWPYTNHDIRRIYG